MDVVYLYGPPAVGKLTVARELAARTGYRVFHNHLSIDCVRPVFDFGSESFWRQVHTIIEGMLGEAARVGQNLVFTALYAHPHDLPQTKRRFEAVEGNGGRVCLVRLTAPTPVLEDRISEESRRRTGKLATLEGLRRVLAERELSTPIPGRDSLNLDTGDLSAAEAAKGVIEWYQLPMIDKPS